MNNYCFTCVVDEKKRTVISEVEVQETMAQIGIPLCPKHFVMTLRQQQEKRRSELTKPGYLDQLRAEGGV